MKNTTALIISFLRPQYTIDCIKSLKENYPEIRLLVGENGKPDKELKKVIKKYKGEYIIYPFDSGVPYLRNQLIKKVKTKYVLIGDDDFLYDKQANLDKMANFLVNNRKYSMIGGRVIRPSGIWDFQGYLTFGDTIDFKSIKAEHLEYEYCKKSKLKYTEVEMMTNFWIGKVKEIPKWDEFQKIHHEHTDYMIQIAKDKKIKMAFTPESLVHHKKQAYSIPEYEKYRYRKEEAKTMLDKYGVVGLGGDFRGAGCVMTLRMEKYLVLERIKLKAKGDIRRKRYYPGDIIEAKEIPLNKLYRLKRLEGKMSTKTKPELSTRYTDKEAKNYEKNRIETEQWQKEQEIVEGYLKKIKAKKVLDIPVGTGRFLNQGYTVTGIDVSKDMLKEASKKKDKKAELIEGDIFKLDYKEEFDVAISLRFLNWITFEEMEQALKILKDATKKYIIAGIHCETDQPHSIIIHDKKKVLKLFKDLKLKIRGRRLARKDNYYIFLLEK